MSRAGAMMWAAALILGTVSGCVSLDATNLNVFVASNDNEKVLNGSVESVSGSMAENLRKMGGFVNVTPQGDTTKISSCTKDGKRFNLVLSSFKGASAVQTRIRIEWVDEPDVHFWFGLIEVVATAQMEHAK